MMTMKMSFLKMQKGIPTAMDEEVESTEEYDVPLAIQHKFAGVPREIRNLQAFFNPDPGAYWENLQGEADLMMLANDKAHETALIATMYDGSPEPKTYYEATQCHDFPNRWGAICTEFNNMEQKVVWEIIPKDNVPIGRKIIGSRWVSA
jgi:hypothetical protein